MKNILFPVVLSLVFLLSNSVLTYSQTAGTLSFSCSTNAPSGNWGNKHVLAIWIENTQSPSAFIKTKAKYGNEDDHLTSWVAKSGKNKVDAVTGATLGSYSTQSIIWDGTDVNSNVVPDGNYKVFIEMGWGKDKTAQHSVSSYTFTKGVDVVNLTPAGNDNYSNVSIAWTPSVTFSDALENSELVSVFPNPSNGIIKLDFKKSIPSAKIRIENELGSLVYAKNLETDFTGLFQVDLSSFSNGLYLVKVISPEQKFVYKVILNR
jgi:hypothetical protein